MTATQAMPTRDQLEAYAQKLPKIYRDVLRAIQDVEPRRRQGEGVFESSLRNYYFGRQLTTTTTSTTTTPSPEYGGTIPFATQDNAPGPDDFSLVLERLAERGFLHPLTDTRFGTIVPTALGEALIATITGRTTPKIDVPELPPLTW